MKRIFVLALSLCFLVGCESFQKGAETAAKYTKEAKDMGLKGKASASYRPGGFSFGQNVGIDLGVEANAEFEFDPTAVTAQDMLSLTREALEIVHEFVKQGKVE